MYNACMKRYTKRFVRFSAYFASLLALGIMGWFGSVQNSDTQERTGDVMSGVLLDSAEADDVGSAGSETGSTSCSDGSGSGDGSGGDGCGGGCSGGCSG